jgi:hypothetical protein
MGQEQLIRMGRPLGDALAELAATGAACAIVMVDAQLVLPSAPAPQSWREVRLKGPAGMVTLRRPGDDDEVALIVFGNATSELLALRTRIAAALSAPGDQR